LNGRGETRPAVLLGREQLLPSDGEAVVLRLPVVVRDTPFGADRAVELEPVKGGVERPFLDLQHLIREQVDRLGDSVAVQRAALEGMEDEEIEGALEEGGRVGSSPASPYDDLWDDGVP
jgi:hypothetical protein